MTGFTDKIGCRFKSHLKSIIGEYQCCLILSVQFLRGSGLEFTLKRKTLWMLNQQQVLIADHAKVTLSASSFLLATQLPRHKYCVVLCTLWACNRPHIMPISVHILSLLVPIKQDPTFVSVHHPSFSQKDRLGQGQTPEKIRQYFVLFAIRTHC